MAARPFPRYFVARGDAPEPVRAVDPVSSIHALDSFFVGGRHVSEREYVVTVDQGGDLNLLPGENKSIFPAELQSELSYSDMIGSGGRLLDSIEFYIFNVQLLEQPGNAPGLNDPVYLYGTLYGPFPSDANHHHQPSGLEGQLTVTRGDLLEGLIQSAKHPFGYSPDSGASGRSLNITLAGDREEEIARGAGIVMAYPMLPGDMVQTNPANELVVTQMLYDVLSGLRQDMIAEKVSSPLCKMTLPVPNRMLVEEQLKLRGYTIEGNTAVIKTTVTQGFQGFLASAFGSIMKDKLDLPPEGTLNEFLEIAEKALKTFRGWPPKRIWALQQRIVPATADIRMRAARHTTPAEPPRVVRTPAPPPPVQATHNHSVSKQRNADGPMANWMKDFVDSHKKPGAPEPRLSSYSQPGTSGNKPSTKPVSQGSATAKPKVKAEWMEDFEEPATPKKGKSPVEKERVKESSAPQSKPDWMKDFE